MVNNTVYEGLPIVIPLCERNATPGPSPTPTPPPPYLAPNLLLPVDGASFTINDSAVTLQWAAVGTLNDNEAYQVTIEDVTDGTGRKQIAYVKDTKYIVPVSFRSPDTAGHVYRWWIRAVRQVGTDESGNPIWVEAGANSNPRVFIWSGGPPGATPTP